MKTLGTIAAMITVMALVSFNQTLPCGSRVEKLNGVDVYAYSIPLREYDVIQTGTTSVVLGQCNGMVSRSAKKAAELKADGVIIHFDNFKFEAIKYK